MKKIFSLIYEILIFIPFGIIATMFTAIIVIIGVTIGNKDFWSYYPPKYWSKFICFLALCPIEVKNKTKLDQNQSYIFIPNHQSIFDVFLIYGYLGQNIKWVQKKELHNIPLVGKASEMAGHVFLDQKNLKAMPAAIKEAESRITSGISLVIFPEGARTKSGKMQRFKRGPFIIAKELNLSLVPITINGAFNVMPINSFWLNPHKMQLVIHDPIPTTNADIENLQPLIDECHKAVNRDLWSEYKI